MEKYITPNSILDWIRKPNECSLNISNQWQSISQAFPVIGKFLAWKLGSSSQVRVGTNVIVGCVNRIFFLNDLVAHLKESGLCTPN